MHEIKSVAIIGIGLIGGSLGLALKQLVRIERVVGVALHQKTLDSARIIGAIDRGTTDAREAVIDAEIVFIATPISSVIDIAAEVIPNMKDGSILTDVGSTKQRIVEEIEQMLPENVSFIGGHPMAGSEMSGIDAASRDLFRNCAYILTPTGKTDLNGLRKLHALISKIGARVLSLDPEIHDRIAATVSHVPHVLSSVLVTLAMEEKEEFDSIFQIAAGGFYDMTRIAASDPNIWVDICFENKQAILEVLRDYRICLDAVTSLLEDEEKQGLREWLESAYNVRKSLRPGKPLKAEEVYDLIIAVPNRPGVISDITRAVGKMGINVEDIQIVHSTEGQSGVLKIVVYGREEAERAAEILREKDYQLSIDSRFV